MFPSNFEAYKPTGVFHCGANSVQIGHSFLPIEGQGQREKSVAMEILHHSLEPLESLMKCVEMNWMAILVGIIEKKSYFFNPLPPSHDFFICSSRLHLFLAYIANNTDPDHTDQSSYCLLPGKNTF